MGRYLNHRIDKAEELDGWVRNLANEFEKKFSGAKFCRDQYGSKRVNFTINDPSEAGEQKYIISGFIGINIDFEKKEPDFLIENDKEPWYRKVMELAGEKFGLGIGSNLKADSWPILENHLYYFSIHFKEETEEKLLYALTPNKKEIIKKGFERLQNYIDFYTSAVKGYDDVVQSHNDRMQQYLEDLDSLSE